MGLRTIFRRMIPGFALLVLLAIPSRGWSPSDLNDIIAFNLAKDPKLFCCLHPTNIACHWFSIMLGLSNPVLIKVELPFVTMQGTTSDGKTQNVTVEIGVDKYGPTTRVVSRVDAPAGNSAGSSVSETATSGMPPVMGSLFSGSGGAGSFSSEATSNGSNFAQISEAFRRSEELGLVIKDTPITWSETGPNSYSVQYREEIKSKDGVSIGNAKAEFVVSGDGKKVCRWNGDPLMGELDSQTGNLKFTASSGGFKGSGGSAASLAFSSSGETAGNVAHLTFKAGSVGITSPCLVATLEGAPLGFNPGSIFIIVKNTTNGTIQTVGPCTNLAAVFICGLTPPLAIPGNFFQFIGVLCSGNSNQTPTAQTSTCDAVPTAIVRQF